MKIDGMVLKSAEISSILKHLSHEKRLQLLYNLIDGEKTVGELSDTCKIGQSQTSQFLKRMELAGLLLSEREGVFIKYKIKDLRLVDLIQQIKKIFCA